MQHVHTFGENPNEIIDSAWFLSKKLVSFGDLDNAASMDRMNDVKNAGVWRSPTVPLGSLDNVANWTTQHAHVAEN